MIKRFILILIAFILTASTVEAQNPPCLLDTPTQRAIWDKMKAENSSGYQTIMKNTTWERYNDIGRWEMTAAIINRDPVMMRRAFAEMKVVLAGFTNIFAGNESREFTVELAVMYGCMYPDITETERKEFYVYNVKVAEGILASLRPGDSDQATGNYLGLVMMDKVMGTTFGSRTFSDGVTNDRKVGGLIPTDCLQTSTLRDAVCNFAKVMSVDGAWPEGTAYNGGTLWFYLAGVQMVGIEYFPEAIPFIKSFTKFLMHEHMPGLKNRFEFGDTEHPNQLITMHGPLDIWQVLQSLLDQIGETQMAAMIRQFQDDFISTNQLTLDPLYARYYYRNNPYGSKAPWREWAGKSYQARGQGLSYWRTGWNSIDRATFVHTPAVSNGIVDHWKAFEIDIRAFRKGVTVIDHPLGYQPDPRFFNTVNVRNMGMSAEVGGVTGQAFEDGVVGYASGFNAGVSQDVYETYSIKVPTVQHGQFRSVFQPLDGPADSPDVWLIVDTIHAEDVLTVTAPGWMTDPPLTVDKLYYKTVVDRFKFAQPITFYWHMPVKPTISGSNLSWTVGATKMSISPVISPGTLTPELIDETAEFCKEGGTNLNCLSGYMADGQTKWQIRNSLSTLPEFSAFVHCVTALESGTASCEPLQSASGSPLVGGVILRTGLPTVSFLSSAVVGPKLTTSVDGNGRVRWDHSKGAAVVNGTRVCAPFTFNARGGDVYIADLCDGVWSFEQAGVQLQSQKVGSLLRIRSGAGTVTVKLNEATPPPPPPPPPPACVEEYKTFTVTGGNSATNAQWDSFIAARLKEGWRPFLSISTTRAVFQKICPK